MKKAQFLQHVLEEEKRRNTSKKAWIYKTHANEAQEAIAMKAKLRVAKKSIDNFKNTINK